MDAMSERMTTLDAACAPRTQGVRDRIALWRILVDMEEVENFQIKSYINVLLA